MCVCVCVCVCARASLMHVCVCACIHVLCYTGILAIFNYVHAGFCWLCVLNAHVCTCPQQTDNNTLSGRPTTLIRSGWVMS